jgi:hypothetical protein
VCRCFLPEVALHLVKIACEMPDKLGVSLSQWDATELARKLIADSVVESISLQTVQRIVNNHKLKPWRHHLWQSAKVVRDEAFCATVKEICTLYTRRLKTGEIVLCLDEKTNLQPRTRTTPTLAAKPALPIRVEQRVCA